MAFQPAPPHLCLHQSRPLAAPHCPSHRFQTPQPAAPERLCPASPSHRECYAWTLKGQVQHPANAPSQHLRLIQGAQRPADLALRSPASAPRVWFVPDALGIVCASATWALTLSEGALLLSAWLLPAQRPAYSTLHGSLFHLLASLALASHARTMLTDPGALPVGVLPAGAPPAPSLTARCPLCGAVRTPGAHHCGVCQRCIRRAHLHCPWVNNCVGEHNRKFFVLFTLYTALGALHTPVRLRGSLLFLFMVALNGFLFAGLMFTIQIHSILTDPQSQPGEPGQASAWTNLKAVLGPRPSPAWISPFASAGPRAASGPQAVV
ncbi:palmitoyltransferase ZDHHC3 [Bubalus bubalis]|uniref:palmitoyltransferase ZDHHC3 n=1 Tax=Bubalus bubalis TaxID=89462 RepID=UPI000DBC5430|nr:palmitoyltransferase ZDHHC3 [Bubalus bubalis]